MKDYEQHEQFEMEVLSLLNSNRLLSNLVFGGGTMLRLCHEMNRYSIDLDFYLKKQGTAKQVFTRFEQLLESKYDLTDIQNKLNTALFEFRAAQYPMRLKIEINKIRQYPISRQCIAYSRFSSLQVMLETIPLDQMMQNKCEALLSRKEIRDAFDIEFLIQRGISLPNDQHLKDSLLSVVQQFSRRDFAVKLGSVLPAESREYYRKAGFTILKRHLGS